MTFTCLTYIFFPGHSSTERFDAHKHARARERTHTHTHTCTHTHTHAHTYMHTRSLLLTQFHTLVAVLASRRVERTR